MGVKLRMRGRVASRFFTQPTLILQPGSGSCLYPHPKDSQELSSPNDPNTIIVVGLAGSMKICFLSQPVFPYSEMSLYVDRGVRIQNFFTNSF